MAEPSQKKRQKTEEDADFKQINDFLQKDKNRSYLKMILDQINFGVGNTSVYFVQVRGANASVNSKFSTATIDADFIKKGQDQMLYVPLALFFGRGFGILLSFVNKDEVPEDMDERRALLGLIKFLERTAEQSVLLDRDKESAAALAIHLAQHLLVPLVPQKTYVIDSYSGLQYEKCCSVEHPMNGTEGDTSYGCPYGWHGRADVLLMDAEIPLSVVNSSGVEGDADTASVVSDSSVEENESDTFSPDSISQVIAQTIVYSFVQHKKNPVSSNSMVPGIGISSNKMILYLYDCVEDILLASGPVRLFADMKVNTRAIIILWLALNYKHFGNSTLPVYKKYTSKFHELIGPVTLKRYQEESEQPFERKLENEDFFKTHDDLEAKERNFGDDAPLATEAVPENIKTIPLKLLLGL